MNKYFISIKQELQTCDSAILKKIILLGLILIGLIVVSFFVPSFVYVAFTFAMLVIPFIKGIKKIYLLVFLLPFYSVLRYNVTDLVLSSFLLAEVIVLEGLVFFINVIRGNKKINWVIFTLFCLLLLYIWLPFGKYNFPSLLKLSFTIIVCFLVYNKEELNLKSLMFMLILGLLLASIIEPLRYVSSRLECFLPDFYVGTKEIIRFTGLTTDPNYFAVELILSIALCMLFYIKEEINIIFWACFIVLSILGFLTLSKAFLIVYVILLAVLFFYKLTISIKNKQMKTFNIFLLKYVIAIILVCAICYQQFVAFLDRFLNVDGFVEIEKGISGSKVLNVLTTGRTDIWGRYIKEIFSSGYTFVFGHGVGADLVVTNYGETAAHNFFIELFYHLGLLGVGLLLALLICMFVHNKKKKHIKVENFLVLIAVFGMLCSLNGLISYRAYILWIFVCYALLYNSHTEKEFIIKKLRVNEQKCDFLVSIIIPIYNVQKYLNKCVDSLCQQNLKSTEILLIDDGSTDDSGKIADALSIKYQNVLVFHKQNGGLSDARNYGVEKARGKYLIFIDSDDYVDENFIKIYEYLNTDIDIFFMGYTAEFLSKIKKIDYETYDCYFENKDVVFNCLKVCSNKNSVWSKIINRSFFVTNKLWFNNGFAEDFNWLGRAMQYVSSGAIIPVSYYHYIAEREGSLMNTKQKARLDSVIKHAQNIKQELQTSKLSIISARHIENYIGFNILSNFRIAKSLDSENKNNAYQLLAENWDLVKHQEGLIENLFVLACKILGFDFMYKFI